VASECNTGRYGFRCFQRLLLIEYTVSISERLNLCQNTAEGVIRLFGVCLLLKMLFLEFSRLLGVKVQGLRALNVRKINSVGRGFLYK